MCSDYLNEVNRCPTRSLRFPPPVSPTGVSTCSRLKHRFYSFLFPIGWRFRAVQFAYSLLRVAPVLDRTKREFREWSPHCLFRLWLAWKTLFQNLFTHVVSPLTPVRLSVLALIASCFQLHFVRFQAYSVWTGWESYHPRWTGLKPVSWKKLWGIKHPFPHLSLCIRLRTNRTPNHALYQLVYSEHLATITLHPTRTEGVPLLV